MLYIVVTFQNPTSNVTVSPQTVCISFPKKYYTVWIGTVRDSETASLCNEASKFFRKSALFEYYISKSALFNPHYMSPHYLNPWPHYLNPQYLNQHCLNISPKIHTVWIFSPTKIWLALFEDTLYESEL